MKQHVCIMAHQFPIVEYPTIHNLDGFCYWNLEWS